ncbi:hypothetical protein EVAR_14571_1 [Eumeta japonica]|uniref:Uncharacterized protein n=1 Tax=Eumeta variegata TaxID=151549 RepID=A0A4C1UW75_EUMVA|nr:hypothetical protein EVAR_14571_1 [Eumeta japonica]
MGQPSGGGDRCPARLGVRRPAHLNDKNRSSGSYMMFKGTTGFRATREMASIHFRAAPKLTTSMALPYILPHMINLMRFNVTDGKESDRFLANTGLLAIAE